MDDQRPTRTIGYWRDFHPSRYLVPVGGAARQIFEAISADYGLLLPKMPKHQDDETPSEIVAARRAILADWLKTIPVEAKRLSVSEREQFVREHNTTPDGFIDAP